MSATNRGSVRRPQDLYCTPEAAFRPMLPIIEKLPMVVWDPACGDGRLIDWMMKAGIRAAGTDIVGYPDGDFLKDQRQHATIVTNPPFSLALEFCLHAVHHSNNVLMLLRLGFLASRKRAPFFRLHPVNAIFILSARPSFTEDGKTDAADYFWGYWGSRFSGIHWL